VVGYVERTYGGHYSGIAARPDRIALIDLEVNRRVRGAPPPGLVHWQQAASDLGFEFEPVTLESLSELAPDRYVAAVLPEQERLADEDWEALLELARGGLGLVLTGHPGLQRADGSRRDRVLLEALAPGVRFERVQKPPQVVSLADRGPVVAGLLPGARLDMETGRALLVRRGDGSLRLGDPRDGRSLLLLGRVGDAAVVWLGLPADQLQSDARAQRLLRNTLHYAARAPVAELRAWPGGAVAAAVVPVPDALVSELAAAGLPGDLRTDPAAAELDPDLLLGRLLAEYANVERTGGLFALADSGSWLDRPEREILQQNLLRELEAQQVWIAQAPELIDWWKQRADLDLVLERTGAGEAQVVLTNRGDTPLSGATTRVFLPPGARPPTEVERTSWLGRPVLRVGFDRSWFEVIAPELEPGETVTYTFNY
jgi:hypothetical protein